MVFQDIIPLLAGQPAPQTILPPEKATTGQIVSAPYISL
jgi:hypothetical protein